MARKVETTHTFDVTVSLTGTFQPGCPEQGPTYASGGQPAEPDMVEDIAFISLTTDVLVPAPPAERGSHPRGIWKAIDLLDGLDEAARQIVLLNITNRVVGQRLAEELLMQAVPEDPDPDDERDRRRDDELTTN